jgi:hypothetical protein
LPHPAIIANDAVTTAATAERNVLEILRRFPILANCASANCKPSPTFPSMLTTLKARL